MVQAGASGLFLGITVPARQEKMQRELLGRAAMGKASEIIVVTERKPLFQCSFDLFCAGFHLSAAGFAFYLPLLNSFVIHYAASSAYLGKWRARIRLSSCLTHHCSTSFSDTYQKTHNKKTKTSPPSNILLLKEVVYNFFCSCLKIGHILPYIMMLFSCLAMLYTLSQLFAMQFNS